MTEARSVYVVGPDEFTACPSCGMRPPNDSLGYEKEHHVDEDGPVFEAECSSCGPFLWQDGEDFE